MPPITRSSAPESGAIDSGKRGDIVQESAKGREPRERLEAAIGGAVGDIEAAPMGLELLEPPAYQTAGSLERLMERSLRVGERLEILDPREPERLAAVGIPRGDPDRSLVKEQPGLLHPHRHHADIRDGSHRRRDGIPRRFDFGAAQPRLLPLCVAMDEQQVAWEQLHGPMNAFPKARRPAPNHPEVRPLSLREGHPARRL